MRNCPLGSSGDMCNAALGNVKQCIKKKSTGCLEKCCKRFRTKKIFELESVPIENPLNKVQPVLKGNLTLGFIARDHTSSVGYSSSFQIVRRTKIGFKESRKKNNLVNTRTNKQAI